MGQYRVVDGGVLLALDGLWHYSSKEVHCEHCLHMTNPKGETTYYHSAVAGAIVKPGSSAVIPVMGEAIRNGDGEEKQDCEHEAGKRWLLAHGQEYRWLKATLLGDDLYSDHPFCERVLQGGMSFLFTCKADSRRWLTETVENSYVEEKEVRKWTWEGSSGLYIPVDKRGAVEGQSGRSTGELPVFPDRE
jgi:hypothetical protein